MKKAKLKKGLKVESFTTTRKAEVKGGFGRTEHCDYCPATQALRSCPFTAAYCEAE